MFSYQSQYFVITQTHLFRAEFCIALPQFAWSAFNNCIAEHCNHHHKKKVTGMHEMQVYKRAIILHRKLKPFIDNASLAGILY